MEHDVVMVGNAIIMGWLAFRAGRLVLEWRKGRK